jgi:hypothetical protein
MFGVECSRYGFGWVAAGVPKDEPLQGLLTDIPIDFTLWRGKIEVGGIHIEAS